MKQLKEKSDMSMIMITHDLGIIAQMCDEVAVIYAGRIIEYGELREVFKDTKHPYTQGLFDSLPKILKVGSSSCFGFVALTFFVKVVELPLYIVFFNCILFNKRLQNSLEKLLLNS